MGGKEWDGMNDSYLLREYRKTISDTAFGGTPNRYEASGVMMIMMMKLTSFVTSTFSLFTLSTASFPKKKIRFNIT